MEAELLALEVVQLAVAAREIGHPASPDVGGADVSGVALQRDFAVELAKPQVRAAHVESQRPFEPFGLDPPDEVAEGCLAATRRDLHFQVDPEPSPPSFVHTHAPPVVVVGVGGVHPVEGPLPVMVGIDVAEGFHLVVGIPDAQRGRRPAPRHPLDAHRVRELGAFRHDSRHDRHTIDGARRRRHPHPAGQVLDREVRGVRSGELRADGPFDFGACRGKGQPESKNQDEHTTNHGTPPLPCRRPQAGPTNQYAAHRRMFRNEVALQRSGIESAPNG